MALLLIRWISNDHNKHLHGQENEQSSVVIAKELGLTTKTVDEGGLEVLARHIGNGDNNSLAM